MHSRFPGNSPGAYPKMYAFTNDRNGNLLAYTGSVQLPKKDTQTAAFGLWKFDFFQGDWGHWYAANLAHHALSHVLNCRGLWTPDNLTALAVSPGLPFSEGIGSGRADNTPVRSSLHVRLSE